MDFLNHRVGGMVFYQVFLFFPLMYTVPDDRNCKRLREFDEIEISRQSCRWTVNSKKENSYNKNVRSWSLFLPYAKKKLNAWSRCFHQAHNDPNTLLYVRVRVRLVIVCFKPNLSTFFTLVPHADDNRIGPCRAQQQKGSRDHQYQ